MSNKINYNICFPFKFIGNHLKETACSSFQLAKIKNKTITVLDFVMQVQPNWMYYLAYTALRCMSIGFQYKTSPKEKRYEVWQKLQLYSSTKVTGILVSQIALTALGFTTLTSVAIVLSWGLFLASISCYAHLQSNKGKGKPIAL